MMINNNGPLRSWMHAKTGTLAPVSWRLSQSWPGYIPESLREVCDSSPASLSSVGIFERSILTPLPLFLSNEVSGMTWNKKNQLFKHPLPPIPPTSLRKSLSLNQGGLLFKVCHNFAAFWKMMGRKVLITERGVLGDIKRSKDVM